MREMEQGRMRWGGLGSGGEGHQAGELKGERQGWFGRKEGGTEGRTEGERRRFWGDLLFWCSNGRRGAFWAVARKEKWSGATITTGETAPDRETKKGQHQFTDVITNKGTLKLKHIAPSCTHFPSSCGSVRWDISMSLAQVSVWKKGRGQNKAEQCSQNTKPSLTYRFTQVDPRNEIWKNIFFICSRFTYSSHKAGIGYVMHLLKAFLKNVSWGWQSGTLVSISVHA